MTQMRKVIQGLPKIEKHLIESRARVPLDRFYGVKINIDSK